MKDLWLRVGSLLLFVLVLLALLAPVLSQYSPSEVPEGISRTPPDADHWFGTDQIGRDVFARTLYGARTSLTIGLGGAALAGVIGLTVGVWSGWRRGWVDALLGRVTEVFLVLPGVLIAAGLVLVTGRSVPTLVLILGVTMWPVIARVVRAETMRVSSERFVEAAVVSGATSWRVVRRHVLPHVVPAFAVVFATVTGTAILAESSLSFLGIGVVDPTSSWGGMINGGRRSLTSAPHIIAFPAGAVFLTVLAFVCISNGLRSLLKVRR